MKRSPFRVPASVGYALLSMLALQACVMATTRAGDPDGGGPPPGSGTGGSKPGGGTGGGPPAPPRNCVGLECQQTNCQGQNCAFPACTGGQQTTLSGTIYDPAGKVPLYNINVYVPNAKLADLLEGAICDRCETPLSGSPLVSTQTDARGTFKLLNIPAGKDVPLVIQVGKWRRQVTLPPLIPCVDNKLEDRNLARLPKNQMEGHIPKIALTTGGADALECLLRKIGIEDSEFTPETGTGRINLFAGTGGTDRYLALNAGAMFTPAPTWWESGANLNKYDLILHSCEGTERPVNKSAVATQALLEYANKGGRVFASHWHNYWFEHGPEPFPTVANFRHSTIPDSIVSNIDTSFIKGAAMADWLVAVMGSTVRGQLPITGAKHTVDAVNPMVSQRWIYYDTPASVQYLTANTPIGVSPLNQCGRVVFSDIHVSSGVGDTSSFLTPFPMGCTTVDLSPQEKALEFMLFDLSACIDSIP